MTPATETPRPIAEILLAKGYKPKKDNRGRGYCTLHGKRISGIDYTRAWIDEELARRREAERAAA